MTLEAPLAGHVALVTGCGRKTGLGRAIAHALASAGADLAVTDLAPSGSRNTMESGDEEWRGLPDLVNEIETL